MKKIVITGFVVALFFGVAVCKAQEAPEFPTPVKEHEWLQQLVGEWDAEAKMFMEPGQPPLESKGTESIRAIGGFWVQGEYKSDFEGRPFTGLMTLGYNGQKKHYVGTWVDSMTDYLWSYKGTLDKSGQVLTLEATGPNPSAGGQMTQFKDVIEVKSKDHKVLTSSMQLEDGKWLTIMTINYRRKK